MATGATLLTDHPFRRPHLSTLLRSSNIPSFHPLRISIRINRLRPNFRCSIAEGSTALSPSKGSAPSSIVDCVVIGGGISGLCIAQALATKHSDVAPNILVTEARGRVGGNITTVERDGYLWEEGPNSFQPSDPILTMVVDSGLKDDLVLGDPDAPRFVLWDGKLRPVPAKPNDLPFFDLMSLGGKIRAGFGALGIRPPPPGREESVEEFVRRNLGDEVFERLIEPFCSGVYAGDPSKLSMKAAFGKVWKLEQNGGSIIGGTFKAFQERNKADKPPRDPRLPKPKGQTVGSFRKGLAMLPNAISTCLGSKVKLSWKLSSISKMDDGGYSLTYETPEGPISILSRSVIMTVPSYVASTLLRPISVTAADALSKFYYPPVASVTISYPKEAIRKERLVDGELKGFGQLHPRSQGVTTFRKAAISAMTFFLVLFSLLMAASPTPGSEVYSAATTSLITDQEDSGPLAKLHAKHARMLVHENVWGMLATTSVTFPGSAFANVASYSDGVGFAKEDATGTLFFYLSVEDFTAMDLKANPNATMALSKAQGGPNACYMDAEDPTCWRLSMTGKVVQAKENQRGYAERVVFSKHPQMKHWPKNHGFAFYVLEIEHIVFLDFYGAAKHIAVSDYYKVKL